jgi:hypothetical protein
MKYEMLLRGLALNLLVSLPALLGFGIILTTKGPLDSLRLAFCCFLTGFTGVIVMVRKESPTSIGTTRGKWAVVEGLIFTIILWVTAIYFWLFG